MLALPTSLRMRLALLIFVPTAVAACAPAIGPTATATPAAPLAAATEAVQDPKPAESSPTPAATVDPTPTAPTPTPIVRLGPPANPQKGDVWQASSDGMMLHFIPGGTFRMGALPDFGGAEPDEVPLHEVAVSAFWMDETEVTWSMYQGCVRAGACSPANLDPPAADGGDHPVFGVTWHQAASYCSWAGRRLPTEAEWEKAARGRDARRYPWGWIGAPVSQNQIRLNVCDASCQLAFHATGYDDGWAQTAPVGSFPAGASPFGLMDMGGNVWEWTADWYAADAYHRRTVPDPSGPDSGLRRVIRGGSWSEALFNGVVLSSRTTNRFWLEPARARPDLGFRCVLPASIP